MTEVDSLNIKITATAEEANKQLDGLIGKLATVSNGISKAGNSIKNAGIENQLKNISKFMDPIASSAKAMEKSVSASTRAMYNDVTAEMERIGQAPLRNFYSSLSDLKVPEINEDNLYKLQSDFEKTKARVEELRFQLDNGLTLGTIKEDLDDKKFVNLQTSLALANKEAEALGDAINRSMETAPERMQEFEEKLSQLKVPDIQESNLTILKKELESADATVEKLKADLSNGITMGRIDANVDDKQYTQLAEKIALAENRAAALQARINEVEGVLEQAANGTAGSLEGEGQSATSASEAMNILENNKRTVADANEQLGGTAGGTEEKLKEEGGAASSLGSKFRGLLSNVLDIRSAFNSFASGVSKVVSKLSSLAGALTKTKSSSKGLTTAFSKGLRTILRYGFGIRSVYFLFRKIRTAIKEGMNNLVQYSNTTNASVSLLYNSMNQLKNASAAMLEPVLNAFAPAINTIIQGLIKATNAVNQFFSALVGNSTWTKATVQTEDYASSLSDAAEAAKDMLMPFDEINKLSDDSSGSGSNSTDASDMFTTETVGSKYFDIVSMIKEAWASADFTELGSLLGGKLQSALENISWDNVKESARNLGASIATLINGFVTVDQIGTTVGKTVAEGLNTAFEYAHTFVTTFNWEATAKAISDAFNGFFENINWNTIKATFTKGFKNLAKGINKFISNFNWNNISETVSNVANTITESIFNFFSTVNWDSLGSNIGDQIQKSIESINWRQLGRALGSIVQSALDFLVSLVSEMNLLSVAQAIIDTLAGFFEQVDMGAIASVILTGIGAALVANTVVSIFATAGATIAEAITAAIATPIGAVSVLFAGLALAAAEALNDIKESVETTIDTTVFDALADNGGMAFSTLLDESTEAIKGIDDNMDSMIDKINGIEETKTSISNTVDNIHSIETALKNGVATSEDSIFQLIDQFELLRDQSMYVFSEEYAIITQGLSGALGAVLEDMGYDVEAVTEGYATIYSNAQQKNKELTEAQDALRESYENGTLTFQEYTDALNELHESTEYSDFIDELSGVGSAADEVSDNIGSLSESALDMTEYFKDGVFQTEKYNEDLAAYGNTVDEVYEKILDYCEGLGMSIDEFEELRQTVGAGFFDETVDWAGLLGVDTATQASYLADLDSALGTTYDKMQQGLLEQIPDLVKQAQDDYESLSPLEKLFAPTEGDYVKQVIDDWAGSVYTPAMEGMEDIMEQVGMDASGSAQEALSDVVTSLFDVTTADIGLTGQTKATTTKLKSNWEEILDNSLGKLNVGIYGENLVKGINKGVINESSVLKKTIHGTLSEDLKEAIEKDWDIHSPSGVTEEYGENIAQGLNNGIENLASSTETTVNKWLSPVKELIESICNSMEEMSTKLLSSVKSSFESVKTVTSSAMTSVTETMSSSLSTVEKTVSNSFDKMVSKITSDMKSAKTAVSDGVKAMKSSMDFTWSLPKLKLPHIKVDGEFSLDPVEVPTYSISWYKSGGLFNAASVIGVGEAGREAVLPLEDSSAMGAIADAILGNYKNTNANEETNDLLKELLTAVKAGQIIKVDKKVLGETVRDEATSYYRRTGRSLITV